MVFVTAVDALMWTRRWTTPAAVPMKDARPKYSST
jgi:hypothetical protein